MKIPKIIHQIWIGDGMPEMFQPLIGSWKEHHPDWEYRFWNGEKSRAFVLDHFPGLLKVYDEFEVDVQRADAIRYLILNKIGGLYIDLDFECFENIEGLLKDCTCVLSLEPEGHLIMQKRDISIGNAFIACVPYHPFVCMLVEEIGQPGSHHPSVNTRVMETTGPYMVTRVFHKFPNKHELTILESKYVYPLTRDEVRSMMGEEQPDPVLQEKLQGSLAIHYWLNSWAE